LRSPLGRPIFAAVPGPTLIVVSDAHLGVTPPAVEAALLAFLETVPTLGDSLLINGDLFDFWYSYSRVIPRRGFHVAAALERTDLRGNPLRARGRCHGDEEEQGEHEATHHQSVSTPSLDALSPDDSRSARSF